MIRDSRDSRRVARRNWIAGLLFGLVVATAIGVWAIPPPLNKFTSGTKAKAQEVNENFAYLESELKKLKAEITKLKTDPDCPPGYTKDSTATTITLCKKGSDEIVRVGNFWIDRYESSLVDLTTWNSGKCDGTGGKCGSSTTGQCGVGAKDFPSTFPDSGHWKTPVYACSVKGNKPSAYMTWFQAQQACLLAGKRLCTNEEWQGAGAVTYDPGSWPDTNRADGCTGTAVGSCNTCSSGPRATGNAGTAPAVTASCISRWGAEDMVGNLFEWVGWWGQAGKVTTGFTSGAETTPWPLGHGDGKDKTFNFNGAALRPAGPAGYIAGMPAAALRGGAWNDGSGAGIFTVFLSYGPLYFGYNLGVRRCRQ